MSPVGKKGFQKGESVFKGKEHPAWNGGKPKCLDCGVEVSNYGVKRCRACYLIESKNNRPNPKGKKTNTGRTHFKKGYVPWNKDKKIELSEKAKLSNEKKKGKSLKKPSNFSETMRKVRPPKGRKVKYDSRDKDKSIRKWRKGYVFIYKPEYAGSKKSPPDYGYIQEHRYVVEKNIGRLLNKGEVVHHLDGDKENNRIENLILCSNSSEHMKIHSSMEMFIESLIRKGEVGYVADENRFVYVR